MSSNVHNFHELRPRIIVMGVGGAGGNAVNNMIASGLHGVEFVAANTDAQALATSGADVRLQLGVNLTEGLGAGSNPEIGEGAAEEVMEEMKDLLSEVHMVFIACGMGGGTGTGAAPVIARIAQELGVLTVAVVTKPFQFEGQRRMRIAESGIEQLRQYVDTMIVIPNQNLFRLANEKTTFSDSFCLADSVLNSGVACVTDLIMKEGLINLDFADVKTVITEMGAAVMGTGVAHGEGRAKKAAEEAISNPLIDDISLAGAKGLLISISGGQDMTLFEVDEVASRIRQEVDPNANIIVGATFDEQLEGYLRVSLVASGLNRGHPQSMHVEADRRRMEIDAEIERNTLGLKERLDSIDVAGGVADPAMLRATDGRMRPQGQPAQDPIQGQVRGQAPGQGLRAPHDGQSNIAQTNGHQGDVASGGRGNVKIVNKPPRFMSPDSEGGYSPPPTPGLEERSTGREFVAGAPETVGRSMRRMPSMEDLPITGQNQLRAYKAPEGRHRQEAQKKKPGLFSRLTGRGRKSEPEIYEGPVDTYQGGHQQEPEAYAPDRGVAERPVGNPQRQDAHGGDVQRGDVQQNIRPQSEPLRSERGHNTPAAGYVAPVGAVAPQMSTSGETQAFVPAPQKQGSAVKPEAPKAEYDLRMEEHYKMHPSTEPLDEIQGQNEAGAHENWVPSRPETPAERYPTLELNKGGVGGVPLDEEDNISDIPPFLKEKREG